jgi:hypothetical protein
MSRLHNISLAIATCQKVFWTVIIRNKTNYVKDVLDLIMGSWREEKEHQRKMKQMLLYISLFFATIFSGLKLRRQTEQFILCTYFFKLIPWILL